MQFVFDLYMYHIMNGETESGKEKKVFLFFFREQLEEGELGTCQVDFLWKRGYNIHVNILQSPSRGI